MAKMRIHIGTAILRFSERGSKPKPLNRIEKEFSQVIDVLLPPYEALAGK
jgi:hypothetical protein